METLLDGGFLGECAVMCSKTMGVVSSVGELLTMSKLINEHRLSLFILIMINAIYQERCKLAQGRNQMRDFF